MTDLAVPEAAERIALEDGRPNATWYRVFAQLVSAFNGATRNLDDVDTGLDTKATKAQDEYGSWTLVFPVDGTETLALNLAYGVTWTKVTTKTKVGTATVTINIDGVPLGGTANAASTSQQEQAHTSANVAAAGADITATLASTSADCEGLTIAL